MSSENTMNTKNFNRGGVTDREYSISMIRLLSLIMIITCHMFQFFNMEIAWWLNVGVQIFLCISGYLYGQRETSEVTGFLKHRFKKILIPYYIVLIPAGLLQFFFARDKFSLSHFVAGLFCRTTIDGGGHLWFVGIILMCYVLTPLLNVYRDKYVKGSVSLCLFAIISTAVATIAFGLFSSAFNPAWICCYIIGYVLGVNQKKKYIKMSLFIAFFTSMAFIGNGIQIYIDYVIRLEFVGIIDTVYGYFCDYNHAFLGAMMFLIMQNVFSLIAYREKGTLRKVLNCSDKYSYEAYLVHQFLILGPFSIMSITPILPVNIVIVICGVSVLTLALKTVETAIIKVFP